MEIRRLEDCQHSPWGCKREDGKRAEEKGCRGGGAAEAF